MGVTALLFVASCFPRPEDKIQIRASTNSAPEERIIDIEADAHRRLLDLSARTDSIVIYKTHAPVIVTNNMGQIWKGFPAEFVGNAVTARQEVATFTSALMSTGSAGDSGVDFSGAIPEQMYLDKDGRPLMTVLVHADNFHVIIGTNLTVIDDQIYSIWPTGVVGAVESELPEGNNPEYGKLALDLVKRVWPEELARREIIPANDE